MPCLMCPIQTLDPVLRKGLVIVKFGLPVVCLRLGELSPRKFVCQKAGIGWCKRFSGL